MSDVVSFRKATYLECLRNHPAAQGQGSCTAFVQPAGNSPNCVACGCHRSFHRRVMFDVSVSVSPTPQPQPSEDSSDTESDVQRSFPPPQQQRPAPAPMMVVAPEQVRRTRTNFTEQQKEKMQELSERIGRRYLKRDLATIEEGCREIGVSSRSFKNWMDNTRRKNLVDARRRASVSANKQRRNTTSRS